MAQLIFKNIAQILLSFIALTCVVSAATADTCVKGEIRSVEFGETNVAREAYCYDDTHVLFVSEACQKKTCLAETLLTQKLPVPLSELGGAVGTPQSALCRRMSGTMTIVEFKAGEAWVKSDLCRFADGSFLNGDLLMKENRDKLR